MGNIDEKTLSSLLDQIEAIRTQLNALEGAVKDIQAVVSEPETLVEPEPVPEPVEEAAEAAEVAEVEVEEVEVIEEADEPEPVVDVAPAAEDVPIDLTISDIELPVPPVVEPVPDEDISGEEPAEEPVADDIMDDIPESVPAPEPVEERKPILDTAKADTAVIDVMAENQAWRKDRPGMPVKNIISAISLNDRVLLINVLFREDPMLFQETISKFNAMGSLNEALAYISDNFPEWDMNSEPVYRLMMAVRRKLS